MLFIQGLSSLADLLSQKDTSDTFPTPQSLPSPSSRGGNFGIFPSLPSSSSPDLQIQIKKYRLQIQHLTELLSENQTSIQRLTDQEKVKG